MRPSRTWEAWVYGRTLAEHQRMLTYQYSRSGSEFESAIAQKRPGRCDLITFLGVAQKLHIEFLPITWQPELDRVGQGATAEIREAIATVNFSFAFQRPISRSFFDFDEFESQLLPCMADEVLILGRPLIRKHPNIVDLEGVCWEIISEKGMQISREIPIDFTTREQGIVPVLVFQKSKYGDLYHFMTQDTGKKPSFSNKVEICVDVARAVAEMHSQGGLLLKGLESGVNSKIGIIHGDIKPQNVLVFDNGSGGYTAKVADFGYSTQWATPNDLIQMPRSQPWAAPEWHHRGFTPAQAKTMDAYSFGMLVLWLMSYTDQNDSHRYWEICSRTATKGAELIPQVAEFASQEHKLDLSPFFNATLTHDTATRYSDFKHMQKLLNPEGYFPCPPFEGSTKGTRITSGAQISRTTSSSELSSAERSSWTKDATLNSSLETAKFEVIPSMYQLYQADYRVRIYVASLFLRKLADLEESQATDFMIQNTLLQCAICFEVGFGIERDPKRSHELLITCGEDARIKFLRELELVKRDQYDWNSVRLNGRTNFQKMDLAPTGRNTPRHNLYHAYIAQEDLQVVEGQYRKEITDTETGLGLGHRFVLELKTELMHILFQCGRHKEAEKLKAQIKEAVTKAPGHEQSRALAAKGNLAAIISISKQQGRLKDADLFCLQMASLASEDFDHTNLATVDALCALASIAGDRGLLKEAEDPSMQILQTSSKVLGQEYPDTLDHTLSLRRTLDIRPKDPVRYLRIDYHVWMLALHQQWTEAEALQKEMVHQNIKVLGREHANTLSSMNQLAVIFLERGQLEKSKVLYLQVIELSEKILGKEHPKTLDYMSRLATVYQQQQYRLGSLAKVVGIRQPSVKAERLHRQVAVLSTKIMGVEHPLTLIRTAWWAWILYLQKRYEEAEKLEVRIVETRARVLGEKHPETLASMRELAYTVRKQGQWKEAQELMSKGIRTESFASRVSQQIQLFLLLIY